MLYNDHSRMQMGALACMHVQAWRHAGGRYPSPPDDSLLMKPPRCTVELNGPSSKDVAAAP